MGEKPIRYSQVAAGVPADIRPSEVVAVAYEVGEVTPGYNQVQGTNDNDLYGSMVIKDINNTGPLL